MAGRRECRLTGGGLHRVQPDWWSVRSPPPLFWSQSSIHELLSPTITQPQTTTATAPLPPPLQLPTEPAAQARHLTTLVHRLQSRPGEDVLAELAACASGMGQEAWDACFSKVSWWVGGWVGWMVGAGWWVGWLVMIRTCSSATLCSTWHT